MFIRNSRRFIPVEQIIDDVLYPAGAFRDPEVRDRLGITEIPDPERKDERFYYVTESMESPYITNTPKPVEQIHPMLWNSIKAKRDQLTQQGGVQVDTKWYHSDTHSKVQQLALLNMGASLPAGIQWKTMDGTFVTMTPALAQQIFAAQVAQEQAIFQIAELHKANVYGLTDVEALQAYDYNAGWPTTYTE